MEMTRALEALLDNYQDFNVGELQQNFYQDMTIELVKRPVQRYSYALMRASMNVFVHHHFAEPLNLLAFDKDSFSESVKGYVPHAWPYFLEEARESLRPATITPLQDLTFWEWGNGGNHRFGAWHRIDFQEFQIDVLFQVSNSKARLGAFEGLCFLHADQNRGCPPPITTDESCRQLGSLHMQIITDEILEALGITPESAISAIKWLMR